MNFPGRAIGYFKRNGFLASVKRGSAEIAGLIDLPWLCYSCYLPGPTNSCEYRIFAQRRSGHHAIINWIKYQVRGRYCFLNDCRAERNPFASCARESSNIASRFAEHNWLFWDRELSSKLSKKGVLLYNYEDQELSAVANLKFDAERETWLGTSKKRIDVLILRDPFNLLASQLKWAYGGTFAPSIESLDRSVELWNSYAREFLGKTKLLTDCVAISFNSWFSDEGYRRKTASNLGLKYGTKGLQEVAEVGPTTWGDSFDGTKYTGRAQEMKVLDRWKTYREDQLYLRLIANPEMLELAREIFGELPEIVQK